MRASTRQKKPSGKKEANDRELQELQEVGGPSREGKKEASPPLVIEREEEPVSRLTGHAASSVATKEAVLKAQDVSGPAGVVVAELRAGAAVLAAGSSQVLVGHGINVDKEQKNDAVGCSSSSSESEDGSGNDYEESNGKKRRRVGVNESQEPEKAVKKESRGRGTSVSLKEMTAVVQAVAQFNFYAAPHKGVKMMQDMCVKALCDKGFTWSVQRIKRFIDGVLADYRAQLKGSNQLPTGNPYDWLQTVHDALSKIETAVLAKESKKRAKALKKERKAAATEQNEERRVAAKEELQKFGTADEAGAALGIKKRSVKKTKLENLGDSLDREGRGEVEQPVAETREEKEAESTSSSKKKSRGRVDIVAQELETKRLEAETKQLEVQTKMKKIAIEEQRLKFEERRLEMAEKKDEATLQMMLKTAEALSGVSQLLAGMKK